MEKKTSIFENGLIWFGAAISLAEILTGTFLAPLGWKQGIWAILLGHLIGCALLFLSGLIGGHRALGAMQSVKITFGNKGGLLFSALNIVQLLGWTAIMVLSGAKAASGIYGSTYLWIFLLGCLITVWLLLGVKNLGSINRITMLLLFAMTVVLSVVILRAGSSIAPSPAAEGGISFALAVELSAAMPLSWLPLISDYTRHARKPFGASLASSVVYFAASSWMYLIGMGAAMMAGSSDIAQILQRAGLGLIAVLIILASTVTTTFMDAYSAGVSAETISRKLAEKPTAIIVTILGCLLALFSEITSMESFLYFIASVFAPMIAIQVSDYFLLGKRESRSDKDFDWPNLLLWLLGFAFYRLIMGRETVLGVTLPAMLFSMAASVLLHLLRRMLAAGMSMKEKSSS